METGPVYTVLLPIRRPGRYDPSVRTCSFSPGIAGHSKAAGCWSQSALPLLDCAGLYRTISDYIGRKPVLLIGMLNNTICALVFGFSTSLPMAMSARFVNGLLTGIYPVGRTCAACARARACAPTVQWGTGTGGSVHQPTRRACLCPPLRSRTVRVREELADLGLTGLDLSGEGTCRAYVPFALHCPLADSPESLQGQQDGSVRARELFYPQCRKFSP